MDDSDYLDIAKLVPVDSKGVLSSRRKVESTTTIVKTNKVDDNNDKTCSTTQVSTLSI